MITLEFLPVPIQQNPEIKAVLFRLFCVIVFSYKSYKVFTNSENQNFEMSERSK